MAKMAKLWQCYGMSTAKKKPSSPTPSVDATGRVVIPKAIRDAAGLTVGAPLDIRLVDGEVVVSLRRPEVAIRMVRHGKRVFAEAEAPIEPVSDAAIRAWIEEQRR